MSTDFIADQTLEITEI